jgi:hypothetical protein
LSSSLLAIGCTSRDLPIGEFFVHLIEQYHLVLNDPTIDIPVEGQEATTSASEDEYLTFLMDEDLIVLSDDASES